MTDQDSREAEATRFTQAAQGLMKAMGDAGFQPETAGLALAATAASFWAERTGRPRPELLVPDSDQYPEVPAKIARDQADFLESLNAAEVADYLQLVSPRLAWPSPEFSTTASLIRVAVAALMPRAPEELGDVNVLDLAAGSASLLLAAAAAVAERGGTPRVLAQDVNIAAGRYAAANIFMSGLAGEVKIGNSLTSDAFPDDQAGLALSAPPMGMSWARWQADVEERNSSEGWYRFGLPPTSDSSWLFASRLIEKLRAPNEGGGRAVTFISASTARGTTGDAIRRSLIEADAIESIIALPSGLHGLAALPLTALVFTNRKARSLEGRVQIVDLRAFFETNRTRRAAPRVLSTTGAGMLVRSLQTTKNGPTSRTVPNERLLRRAMTVRSGAAEQQQEADAPREPVEWIVQVPMDADSTEYLEKRYLKVAVSADDAAGPIRSHLDVGQLFDAEDRSLERQLLKQNWETTRLSALLTQPPAPADQSFERGGNTVFMPTGQGDASTAQTEEPVSGRRLALDVDVQRLSAQFLADWLNSRHGVESRERAIRAASTGSVISAVRSDLRSLWRLADELVVPVPPLEVQNQVSASQSRLDAVASLLAETKQALWESAQSPEQLASRFEPLLDDSFAGWSNKLPFPVASALRALEAERGNVHAALKQTFRVWEAYSGFWGTVLISALGADVASRKGELESIRSTLTEHGLSMARATMGSWGVVVQRLSRYFRDRLGTDQEERARVLQAFGSPPPSTLTQLLDPAVVRLLSEANTKRNNWDGHSAALPPAQLESRLAQMDDLLRELQGTISSAWSELQLVRAGDGSRQGGQIVQAVEILTGPTTPFMHGQLAVGDLMERDGLYLSAEGAAQPLQLQPLIVLRPGPDSVQNTCYFYNRIEGDNVRLVSYHLAFDGEVTEPLGAVRDAVAALIG